MLLLDAVCDIIACDVCVKVTQSCLSDSGKKSGYVASQLSSLAVW